MSGMPVRVVLQRGPKGKKFVAFAIDWPGWSRGAKIADGAVETLETYRERYRPVAIGPGLATSSRRPGPWMSSRTRSDTLDRLLGHLLLASARRARPMTEDELERKIALLRACWAYFDRSPARVSAEMRKGPRGGGRDRDRIIRHTIRTESEDFAKQVGLRIPEGARAGRPAGVSRGLRRGDPGDERGEVEKRMRSWTLPFLIRHSAYHTMDHAWEMEDKDLSSEAQS